MEILLKLVEFYKSYGKIKFVALCQKPTQSYQRERTAAHDRHDYIDFNSLLMRKTLYNSRREFTRHYNRALSSFRTTANGKNQT